MSSRNQLIAVGLLAILLVGSLSAQSSSTGGEDVRWVGEMRQVMLNGDLSGHVDLAKLAKLPHLYAIGPLEQLRGEVTIFDGKPYISRIENDKLVVDKSFAHRACFLVYAQVARWHEVSIPASVTTEAELERFVQQAAKANNLNLHRPFPFRVMGKPDLMNLHVVNKTDNRPFHHEDHEKIKVSFGLQNAAVEIIGFYSEMHHGVFTHHDSNVHMHAKTEDGKTAGHVDKLKMSGGLTLLLPRPY
jgi:acetolactate decarboxylase